MILIHIIYIMKKYKKSEKERLKNIRKNEEIDIIFNNFISY